MTDLEHLWDDLPVGPAPVASILAEGRRAAGRPRRRAIRVGALACIGTVAASLALVGGSGPGPLRGALPGGTAAAAVFHGDLRTRSCDDLLEHYRELALEQVGPYGWFSAFATDMFVSDGAAVAESAPTASVDRATSSETGTNTQEAGVDEPDVVKTDGSLLVRIRRDVLTTYDLSGATPVEVGRLDVDGDEVLLAGSTVVVLDQATSSDEPSTTVTTVDVFDPAAPRVEHTVAYEGSTSVSVHQHGDDVRLVLSRALPFLDFVTPDGDTGQRTARDRNREVVRESTLEDWLPQVSVDGAAPEPLLACDRVAVPDDGSGLGTVAVVGFAADDPADLGDAIGIAGTTATAYESADHLYLTTGQAQLWERTASTGTTIYGFELDGTGARYLGSGTVVGWIADRWSLDEHDGVLRVAAQVGSANSVVTFAPADDRLVETGRLDGLGRGETIQSVRWFDDLAIVVTFRQVDPLYAVDLTDPSAPTLLGELKIPGFSEYLHPLGGRRLLGIGQGPAGERGRWGAQAALFDVTDLTVVRRLDVLSYGSGTQALAGVDPRQLTWLPDRRTVLTAVTGRRGAWLSVLTLADGAMTERRVEVDADGSEVRTLPLPDGRVVLAAGGSVTFLDL